MFDLGSETPFVERQLGESTMLAEKSNNFKFPDELARLDTKRYKRVLRLLKIYKHHRFVICGFTLLFITLVIIVLSLQVYLFYQWRTTERLLKHALHLAESSSKEIKQLRVVTDNEFKSVAAQFDEEKNRLSRNIIVKIQRIEDTISDLDLRIARKGNGLPIQIHTFVGIYDKSKRSLNNPNDNPETSQKFIVYVEICGKFNEKYFRHWSSKDSISPENSLAFVDDDGALQILQNGTYQIKFQVSFLVSLRSIQVDVIKISSSKREGEIVIDSCLQAGLSRDDSIPVEIICANNGEVLSLKAGDRLVMRFNHHATVYLPSTYFKFAKID